MSVGRHFLGWSEPCLISVSRYLLETYQSGRRWDLSSLTLVTPGGRARRRLNEILVNTANRSNEILVNTANRSNEILVNTADRSVDPPDTAAGLPAERDDAPLALLPPTIVTVGELPELLYEAPIPIATDFTATLARVAILTQSEAARLRPLSPHPPPEQDLVGWMGLADELAAIHSELAGAKVNFSQVLAHLRSNGKEFDLDRWRLLETLQLEYERLLAELGYQDKHSARIQALEGSKLEVERRILLISTIDLSPVVREMLRKSRANIVSLIHAPETEAEKFDDVGCLKSQAWQACTISIPEKALRIVDQPQSQAMAIVETLSQLGDSYAADQVTIGLGDEGLASLLERTLELAEVPARSSLGRPAHLSLPALFLSALANYLEDPRVDHFAALVRHPDVERWLLEVKSPDDEELRKSADRYLQLLDDYVQERLPREVLNETSEPSAEQEFPNALARALALLIPPSAQEKRPLSEWTFPIHAVLRELYAGRKFRRFHKDDEEIVKSIELIAQLLEEQSKLCDGLAKSFSATASQTLRLLLRRMSRAQLPAPEQPESVEILGWLELQLDDAPVALITGANEGFIPQSMNADTFLPNALRHSLGLNDNRQRYARDAFLLRAILESRPVLRVIAGKKSARNEPLLPSRFLFADSREVVVRRTLSFFGEAEQPSMGGTSGLLRPGREIGFYLPRPARLRRPISRMSVTAFRSYLACPYRFYLQHVLRLTNPSDQVTELDGGQFGQLAHTALGAFGESELRDSTDPEEIRSYLLEKLAQLSTRQFGQKKRAAVEIQLSHLERRLELFARWQSERRQAGWSIQMAERKVSTCLEVGGKSIELHGRLDRIDRHPSEGFQILDYKFSDTARSPEQSHRKGPKGAREWIELQLPLYRRLVPSLGIDPKATGLGYINLSKTLDITDILKLADWSTAELQEADEVADQVIHDVLDEKFWPPADPPPPFSDDFAGICMDRCVDRSSYRMGERSDVWGLPEATVNSFPSLASASELLRGRH